LSFVFVAVAAFFGALELGEVHEDLLERVLGDAVLQDAEVSLVLFNLAEHLVDKVRKEMVSF